MPAPSPCCDAVLWGDYVDTGLPKPDNFKLAQVPLPAELQDGQVLLETLYISVDPYLRGMMRNAKSYLGQVYQPGQPCKGYGLGIVKESKAADVAAGDLLMGNLMWQQLQVQPAASLNKVDAGLLKELKLPASVYLGALGMTGMTAYTSLERIGKPKAGETVFVSGAAGAVGLMVGQLCKHVYGCTVVGSAGSDEKVAVTKKYGYDAAFNYKTKDTKAALAELCPNGIDVYYDNVGGATLEAALDAANPHARVVSCGSISTYNTPLDQQYGVKNLFNITTKRILMQGFIVGDFAAMRPQFLSAMAGYLREGKVQHVEHVVPGGLQAVGQAFIDMMGGANIGKTVVQCGNDPFRQ